MDKFLSLVRAVISVMFVVGLLCVGAFIVSCFLIAMGEVWIPMRLNAVGEWKCYETTEVKLIQPAWFGPEGSSTAAEYLVEFGGYQLTTSQKFSTGDTICQVSHSRFPRDLLIKKGTTPLRSIGPYQIDYHAQIIAMGLFGYIVVILFAGIGMFGLLKRLYTPIYTSSQRETYHNDSTKVAGKLEIMLSKCKDLLFSTLVLAGILTPFCVIGQNLLYVVEVNSLIIGAFFTSFALVVSLRPPFSIDSIIIWLRTDVRSSFTRVFRQLITIIGIVLMLERLIRFILQPPKKTYQDIWELILDILF